MSKIDMSFDGGSGLNIDINNPVPYHGVHTLYGGDTINMGFTPSIVVASYYLSSGGTVYHDLLLITKDGYKGITQNGTIYGSSPQDTPSDTYLEIIPNGIRFIRPYTSALTYEIMAW